MRHRLDVVRVDLEGLAHLGGRAGELAEDEHAVLVGAGRDELLRHEVHAVAQRRHEHDVRRSVERHDVVLRERPVHVVDGHPVHRRERAVDAPDELVHRPAELLVARDLVARGDGDLDEPHLAAPVRLALEQALERQQAPRDALGVIEPVDPQEDPFAARVGADARGLREHVRVLGEPAEGLRVDADGEDAEADLAAVDEDALPGRRDAQDSQDRRGEVAPVRERVKPDEVRAEHPFEDLLPPRQDPQDLRGGEGDVQEEADGRAVDALAKHLRHERQLVVVNPDEVARAPDAGDRVGEPLVDRAVHLPLLRVGRNAIEQIVKERPEDGVGEPVVIAAHLDAREVDRDAAQLFEVRVQLGALGAGHARHVARPADPQAA